MNFKFGMPECKYKPTLWFPICSYVAVVIRLFSVHFKSSVHTTMLEMAIILSIKSWIEYFPHITEFQIPIVRFGEFWYRMDILTCDVLFGPLSVYCVTHITVFQLLLQLILLLYYRYSVFILLHSIHNITLMREERITGVALFFLFQLISL